MLAGERRIKGKGGLQCGQGCEGEGWDGRGRAGGEWDEGKQRDHAVSKGQWLEAATEDAPAIQRRPCEGLCGAKPVQGVCAGQSLRFPKGAFAHVSCHGGTCRWPKTPYGGAPIATASLNGVWSTLGHRQ